jgi:N-acetylglucosamine kinase-like BadF-type ATPase
MTRYYLGVDVGGTKSHALIADATGRAVGFGQAGPGNHEVVGYDGLRQVLEEITAQAEAMASIRRGEIAGAGFGVGGYDWPSERAATLEAIAVLGLQAPVEAVNDTIVGLLAGAEQGWGVALIAGTSNNCRGWDRNHREGRVLGNGVLFGEHGGAYELVLRAVQDVAKAWTRRGPPTALTDAFIRLTGAAGAADLLDGLSQERYVLGGEAAPLVFQVAEEGDPVALAAIRWNAEELGSLAVGVIRQLGLQNESFDVVLVGSFYNGGPLLLNPLAAAIHTSAPRARLVRLTVPPVVGAVLLGMTAAGVDPAPVRAELVESLRVLHEQTGLAVAQEFG